MINEPFNCSTIKGGITTQRATPQSVHSNLFGHASLSPTFSVPSHSCLVVNTSITACPPSRNSTFLNQSGELGQFHIPTNGSSIKLSNNGVFCVLIRSSFHKAQRTWLCDGQQRRFRRFSAAKTKYYFHTLTVQDVLNDYEWTKVHSQLMFCSFDFAGAKGLRAALTPY